MVTADNHSMAMVELTGYVARSHKESFDHFGKLFRGWNVPCLGLTVVGPYVTFYGIIFLGQWRIAALTPTLSCLRSACEGGDRRALCAAFHGASTLLRHIHDDVKHFVNTPPTPPLIDRRLPYISEVPKYPDENEKIRFKILRRHHNEQADRNLYIAQLETSDDEVIVKFTRHYSIELHDFCARRGHAPTILGFGSIPGGWYVTAMVYISSSMSPSQSSLRGRLRDKWDNDLRELVKAFHDEGLVHGDLREPNMVCSGEDVMLLDFDWGGRVGEASYPCAWLNPELLDGRESDNLRITKEDDNRILRNTLARFKDV
ncbi:hypothetical protein EDB84DRAFT_1473900 [Lactarius hengduanensis]|nr:hypothetical protein EDB84DRAFT_1473900 [Lactarius hengduanensis]